MYHICQTGRSQQKTIRFPFLDKGHLYPVLLNNFEKFLVPCYVQFFQTFNNEWFSKQNKMLFHISAFSLAWPSCGTSYWCRPGCRPGSSSTTRYSSSSSPLSCPASQDHLVSLSFSYFRRILGGINFIFRFMSKSQKWNGFKRFISFHPYLPPSTNSVRNVETI